MPEDYRIPVKEGSRLTNDVLQVALAQHYRETRAIEHLVATTQEAAAYTLVKNAEEHLARANDWWEKCCTRVRMTAPEN